MKRTILIAAFLLGVTGACDARWYSAEPWIAGVRNGAPAQTLTPFYRQAPHSAPYALYLELNHPQRFCRPSQPAMTTRYWQPPSPKNFSPLFRRKNAFTTPHRLMSR